MIAVGFGPIVFAVILSAALVLTVTCSAAPVSTWTAQQTTTGKGFTRRATISYGFHRLRIDTQEQQLIINFLRKEIVNIDLRRKRYTTTTLNRLIRQRHRRRQDIESSLASTPDAVRTQLRYLLSDAQESEQTSLRIRPTGEQDTYNKLPCKLVTWSLGKHHGEACLAEPAPVSWSALRRDSTSWVRSAKGMGAAMASSAFLQLLQHGFPIMLEHRTQVGRQTMRMETILTKVRSVPLPRKHFEPPPAFTKVSAEQ